MINAGSNFALLQQQLLEAARNFAEAQIAQGSAKGFTADNTANWRSARWLWPIPGQE